MHIRSKVDQNLGTEVSHPAGVGLSVNGIPTEPISIVCLTTSLVVGGAQMMLYKLLARIDRSRFAPEVISLIEIGPMGEKIQSLGIPLRSLGMRPGIPNLMALVRLIRWIRQSPPTIIHTWMYHADLMGGLAAKLAGGMPVVWSIHNSNLSVHGSRRLTIHTMRMCAQLSRWLPARIVCCSEGTRRLHTELGYATEKTIVIPYGFDVDAFKPDSAARESVRAELQIPADAPIIGLFGRFDPQKDHRNFVRAAAFLHRLRPDVYFLMCGEKIAWENAELREWIEEAGIANACRLLGRRHDMARLTAALDIAASSSSFGEAFPNVIGEAMSCGVPCAVTNVGDSAWIVGQTGRVVPTQNPKALFDAMNELLQLGRNERTRLGIDARCRIQEHFNLPDIVAQYQGFYQEVAANARV